MTFSVGGLIEATDWNTTLVGGINATGANQLNTILGVGTGNAGYGQTQLSPVVEGATVFASNWASMITSSAETLANHQGLTPPTITTPTTGELIAFGPAAGGVPNDYYATLETYLADLYTNRSNCVAQGSTDTTTGTSGIRWGNYLTFSFNCQFGSANQLRYFFNAGGQLKFQFSHPTSAGTINQMITDLAAGIGTIILSSPNSGTVSLAGSDYPGVLKVGGTSPSGSSVNTNNGFYALGAGATTLAVQRSSYTFSGPYTGASYGATNLTLYATNNGSGLITVYATFDEIPTGGQRGAPTSIVNAGTVGTMTVQYPSSTYLTNSWGSPSRSVGISGG